MNVKYPYHKLARDNSTKIVMLIMDGLGGLPKTADGMTELETARTPNLDALAARSICGLHQPIGPGITPGSGPAHLALFGYNPLEYNVGRGVLAALGINFDLRPDDIAARGNFCTVDSNGNVTDRRAGRIPTEKNAELCEKLRTIEVPGVEIFVEPVKDYRILLVLRGEGLNPDVADTDPQVTGRKPIPAAARTPDSKKTAEYVKTFIEKVGETLKGEEPANMLLLRGFSRLPSIMSLGEKHLIKSAAIAAYPMYRGVSRLVGMDILENDGTLDGELDALKQNWNDYDFFYVHVKKIDSYGEDGNFDEKVKLIEEVDTKLKRILELNPDVVIVTGDHSTPAVLKSHSWDPVPVLINSKYCRPDQVTSFGEKACTTGGLGPRMSAVDILPIALANAERMDKFGA